MVFYTSTIAGHSSVYLQEGKPMLVALKAVTLAASISMGIPTFVWALYSYIGYMN
jgi:hypothetical protein